jgi:hypothetical protein
MVLAIGVRSNQLYQKSTIYFICGGRLLDWSVLRGDVAQACGCANGAVSATGRCSIDRREVGLAAYSKTRLVAWRRGDMDGTREH